MLQAPPGAANQRCSSRGPSFLLLCHQVTELQRSDPAVVRATRAPEESLLNPVSPPSLEQHRHQSPRRRRPAQPSERNIVGATLAPEPQTRSPAQPSEHSIVGTTLAQKAQKQMSAASHRHHHFWQGRKRKTTLDREGILSGQTIPKHHQHRQSPTTETTTRLGW